MQISGTSFMNPAMMPGLFNNQAQGAALPDEEAKKAQQMQGLGQEESKTTNPKEPKDAYGQELSEEDKRRVEELKKTDANVKAHEGAHMSAGGGLVRGGASYEYTTGPDGQRYAVAGEVSIDTSPVRGNPQATLAKAQRIRQAALAPADPSSQDRSVAAQAGQMAAEASMELAKERSEKAETGQQQDKTADGASIFKPSGKTQAEEQDQKFASFLHNNNQFFKPSPGSLLNLNA